MGRTNEVRKVKMKSWGGRIIRLWIKLVTHIARVAILELAVLHEF